MATDINAKIVSSFAPARTEDAAPSFGQAAKPSTTTDLLQSSDYGHVWIASDTGPSGEATCGCACGCGALPEDQASPPASDGAPGDPLPTGTMSDLADYLQVDYWADRGDRQARSYDMTSGPTGNSGALTYVASGFSGIAGLSDDIDGMSVSRQEMVRSIFSYLGEVLGIDFVEADINDVPDPEANVDVFFRDTVSNASAGNYAYESSGLPDGPGTDFYNGHDWLAYARINLSENWGGGSSAVNSSSWETMIHEILHVMGLGHQGNYNFNVTVTATEPANRAPGDSFNNFLNDSEQVSIMSYIPVSNGETLPDDGTSNLRLGTPRQADFLALSRYYTISAFEGDTTYGWNDTLDDNEFDFLGRLETYGSQMAWTLIDVSGIDTFDASGWSADQVIDLRAPRADESEPYASSIGGALGNMTIAVGTVIEIAVGGSGSDALIGNDADNTLSGGAGSDTLSGGAGHDSLLGSDQDNPVVADGNDLGGASDNDDLRGQGGADTMRGGQGHDSLYGGSGNDLLFGDVGHDVVDGSWGRDRAFGGTGDDTLHGGPGDDTLLGGDGADEIDGGSGDDDVSGDDGGDSLEGGDGGDTLFGGQGDDTLRGGPGADSLRGGSDRDDVAGGGGADRIYGDRGSDTIDGSWGRDVIFGGRGNDLIFAGAGSAADRVRGDDGNDTIAGSSGDNDLTGGDGRDSIDGAGGADTILGGADADTIDGGAGNDVLDGGPGADDLIFRLDGGMQTDIIVGFELGIDRLFLGNPDYTFVLEAGEPDLSLVWSSGQTLILLGVSNPIALADDIDHI
ncbi:MAG: M10 family metallopeptidase C-terminal domain-containing protein [Pseudomonadota bacterium]